LADADEHSLLVCGGSALNLSGLLDRPTRDVDVLGLVKGPKATLVVEELLPEEVRRAAETVASDLNLPSDWLNDAALEVHRMGLPVGILKRAERQMFGPCLTVYLISRQDQVALKLYAAIDREKGQRHLKDLVAIVPTLREMESAVDWLLNRPTSLQFREAVRRLAEGLGFPKLTAFGAAAVTNRAQRGAKNLKRKRRRKGAIPKM